MTTVTITIDDPNGLDSNQIFLGTFRHDLLSAGFGGDETSGNMGFQRFDDSNFYRLDVSGHGITETGFLDLGGTINSLILSRTPDFLTPYQTIMHVDFALDGPWFAVGGVEIGSVSELTPDSLMNIVLQTTPANLVLIGNLGNDTLHGSFTDDFLRGRGGADDLFGGGGDDTALYDDSPTGVAVNLATGLGAGGDATGDRLFSIEDIGGSNFNDSLTGNAAANYISGASGDDVINGGAGADTMIGHDGNHTYYVDNAGDVVFDTGAVGTDRVFTSVTYTLSSFAGIEALSTTNAAGTTAINLTGNEFANTLTGNAGNNVLNGADGNDTLRGGAGNDAITGGNGNDVLDGQVGVDAMAGSAGNDTYLVDNVSDKVFEALGGGTDTVFAGVNYALQAGQEVEYLRANAGAASLILTGNEFNNVIVGLTGNDALIGGNGNDTLNGGAGNDALTGGNGNDVLDGQAGVDAMAGSAGNDTYLVDNALDKVFEAVGGGSDTVFASVNYALQAGQEVEFLRANAGSAGLTLTGNEFNNTLIGLTGNDALNGGLGNDTLNGGDGNDTLNGSAGNDALSGGNGNDLLIGGVGADTMAGGAGNDAFRWNAPTEGGDNVTDFKLLGTDVLQFNAAAFGFAPGHVLVNGTEFVANNAPVANHAGPTFLMETDVHNLWFDADGNGGGAAVLIAHMNANAVASDFHLV